MKIQLSFIISLLCSVGWWGNTSTSYAQDFNADKPMGQVERSMETNLNWNLQNALLLYYPETKFVVNTKVKLRRVEPKRTLPKLPDALLSKDLTNLPGLPFIPRQLNDIPPEEARNTNLQSHVQENHYQIDRIIVGTLVDQSLTESDWSFIRRFITMTANLDASRGDQVRIETASFPEKASFIKKSEAEKPEATPAPLPVQPVEQPKADSFLLEWFPYIFAAGLAIFLLILFLIGQRNIVKHLKQIMQTAVQPVQPPALAVPPKEKPEQAPEKPVETTVDLSAVEVLRAAAIDAIVGSPAASAKVFNSWIDQHEEAAYFQIAILFTTVSTALLDLVEPYLGHERSEALHAKISSMNKTDVEKNAEPVLKKFDEDIRRLTLKEKFDSEEDALSFLHQMSDEQLQHLLKPLKTGVMAIVLAQLRSNRATKIINKLDAEERKAVLAAMGNIERIPSDVYQHVARQLAGRAQDLKKMRYVKANGVDALVKVLDQLDEQTQTETLQYLETQDINLAKKVRKQFMTFDDLIKMPDDKIRRAALEVDRELLAKSLVTLDEQVVENIINSLPEKLGEIVRASLEANYNISQKDVADARRQVMRALRTKSGQQMLI